MKKIGILCASDTELEPFFSYLKDFEIKETAMLKFYISQFRDVQIIAAYSGVCKVNAAIAAQVLIDTFHVDALINGGTAGGMDKNVQLLDTVISQRMIYHDMTEDILTDFHPWLKNKKTAGLLILVILLLSFAVTLAYYNEVLTLANPLGTSHSGAAMVESFDPESSFLPGETVIKEVSFQNTGKMDLFLRVEVPPQENWYQKGQGSSPPVILEKEAGYDTDHVIKHWNPGVWTDSGQEEGNVDYMNMETAFWSKSYTDENGKSYRYYKQVLPAGKTTDCILESISLSDEVSNDRHDVDYSDKIYKLTFHAEAVPVEEHDSALGVQSQWNMVVQEDSSGVLTWSQGIRAGE